MEIENIKELLENLTLLNWVKKEGLDNLEYTPIDEQKEKVKGFFCDFGDNGFFAMDNSNVKGIIVNGTFRGKRYSSFRGEQVLKILSLIPKKDLEFARISVIEDEEKKLLLVEDERYNNIFVLAPTIVSEDDELYSEDEETAEEPREEEDNEENTEDEENSEEVEDEQ